jgi:hypothetical protein
MLWIIAACVTCTAAWSQLAPATTLGMNHVALASEYQGYGGGCAGTPGCQPTAQAIGQRAIQDAGNLGVKFLRVAVAGYGPTSYPTGASFTGSISGTTLTVTAVAAGTLSVGQFVLAASNDVLVSTQITGTNAQDANVTGTGGIGTYDVSIAQTTAAAEPMSAISSGIACNGHCDLDAWFNNPSFYWAQMEQMFDDLDSANVQIVASFLFNPSSWPAYQVYYPAAMPSGCGPETLVIMIDNPVSCSRALAKQYIVDFITHYLQHVAATNNHTVLFYEFGNELNLNTDLCIFGDSCTAANNISTLQLNLFAADIISTIKAQDTSALVGSGYAFPRQSAFNLLQQPQWTWSSPGNSPPPDLNEDLTAGMIRILHGTQTNPYYYIQWPQVQPGITGGCPNGGAISTCSFDIVTAHLYQPPCVSYANGSYSGCDAYWFTSQTPTTPYANLPAVAACPNYDPTDANCDPWYKEVDALAISGSALNYVGELNDDDRGVLTPNLQNLVAEMGTYAGQLAYASPWDWEDYTGLPALAVPVSTTCIDQFGNMQTTMTATIQQYGVGFFRNWDPRVAFPQYPDAWSTACPPPGNPLPPLSANGTPSFNLEPGFTDMLNSFYQSWFNLGPTWNDPGTPRLVITGACSIAPDTFTVFASASAFSGIGSVSFSATSSGSTITQIASTTPAISGPTGSYGYSATLQFSPAPTAATPVAITATAVSNSGSTVTQNALANFYYAPGLAGISPILCFYPGT